MLRALAINSGEAGVGVMPGNPKRVKKLREMCNRPGSKARMQLDFVQESVHDVADLLKLFLRELPQPLLPTDAFPQMISSHGKYEAQLDARHAEALREQEQHGVVDDAIPPGMPALCLFFLLHPPTLYFPSLRLACSPLPPLLSGLNWRALRFQRCASGLRRLIAIWSGCIRLTAGCCAICCACCTSS